MAVVPHKHQPISHPHEFGNLVASAGQEVAGAACLLCGLVMSATLFLIPVGVPLALVGVALMMSAGDKG